MTYRETQHPRARDGRYRDKTHTRIPAGATRESHRDNAQRFGAWACDSETGTGNFPSAAFENAVTEGAMKAFEKHGDIDIRRGPEGTMTLSSRGNTGRSLNVRYTPHAGWSATTGEGRRLDGGAWPYSGEHARTYRDTTQRFLGKALDYLENGE
jgi:hypothetical protein